ncbi:MAG TPA: hypothetical protein VN924_15275 [Bryobacteraceae bacterium]|nr:hypothetical protein [Bryobacteraceae bacterium]
MRHTSGTFTVTASSLQPLAVPEPIPLNNHGEAHVIAGYPAPLATTLPLAAEDRRSFLVES